MVSSLPLSKTSYWDIMATVANFFRTSHDQTLLINNWIQFNIAAKCKVIGNDSFPEKNKDWYNQQE